LLLVGVALFRTLVSRFVRRDNEILTDHQRRLLSNLKNGASLIPVLCISRHQHQLVRHWQHEDHSPLFSREYKSWPNRMLLLP
jgi:hypothetical protein